MSIVGMVKVKDDSGQVRYFHGNHLSGLSISPIESIYNDISGQPQYACSLHGAILYEKANIEFNLFYKDPKTAEKIADKLMKIRNKK